MFLVYASVRNMISGLRILISSFLDVMFSEPWPVFAESVLVAPLDISLGRTLFLSKSLLPGHVRLVETITVIIHFLNTK